MKYSVRKTAQPIPSDEGWDGANWKRFKSLQLQHYMGQQPKHFPRVQAKVAYDDKAIYVIFHVQDQYVRALAKNHQDAVYLDSCVEFFFTPGTEVELGYFNLEMNCGGRMLFHYQRVPRQDSVVIVNDDLSSVEVGHSMPNIVDPEIKLPTDWTVGFRLPTSFLNNYFPSKIDIPAPGMIWKANFYKCADATSHPHWLTWSPVDHERPDFHRPRQFGSLIFE